MFFDNLNQTATAKCAPFSLEETVRGAAQKMIQAAVKMEVAEFLRRAKYETRATEFRGYPNWHHREPTVSMTVGRLQVLVLGAFQITLSRLNLI